MTKIFYNRNVRNLMIFSTSVNSPGKCQKLSALSAQVSFSKGSVFIYFLFMTEAKDLEDVSRDIASLDMSGFITNINK